MASVSTVDFTQNSALQTDRVKIYQWTLTTADPTGDALVLPAFADKTIQVYGTFGSGTVTIQGANHPTSPTYATLVDASGTAMAWTAADIATILENPYQIRPVLSGSTDATVTVIIVVRSNG